MIIKPKYTQTIAVAILGIITALTLVVLVYIVVFVLSKGLPVISWDFLSLPPAEMGRSGGIFPMVVGSIILPLLAIAIAFPFGLGTAIYLTEYTTENRFTSTIRFGVDCLGGVPSIIFGLFGFIFFVTQLRLGWSLISGALTLAIMVLPTLIRTSEEAIKAVPYSYREVSISLGASKWGTVFKIVLPNALPGILTGVMLSIGRALGETAAVIFTAGICPSIPSSLFDSVRTMSVHFYILAREGISDKNAYGTATVLIIAVLLVNLVSYQIMYRFVARRR